MNVIQEPITLHGAAPERGANGRTEPEVEFDEMARLASSVCRTPLSVVMMRAETGWTKVSGALRTHEPRISGSFCDSVAKASRTITLNDLARNSGGHPDAPVVGSAARFLAAAPIVSPTGVVVGILCTADMVPRVLTAEQEDGLELLAKQIQMRVELRQQRTELHRLLVEKEQSAASLAAGEALFRAFMNASPFLSYIKDPAGRLLFYNRAFAQRFGVSERAWLGRTDDQLWGRDLSTAMRLHDLDVMAGGRIVEGEERLRSVHGTLSCWKTYKFPCRDSDGNTLLAGVAVEVTEEIARKAELEQYQRDLENANDQLRRLSVTDELTTLRNRRAFEERLHLEFSVARRRNRELSILLIDVDFFKSINDRWGHATGDQVLRQLGAVLRTTVRLPDMVARYGGEEFAVLLPESGEDAALGLANRLMDRIAAEQWAPAPVTVSIGVATMNQLTGESLEVVTCADEALYAAKRAGRNRIVVHGGKTRSYS